MRRIMIKHFDFWTGQSGMKARLDLMLKNCLGHILNLAVKVLLFGSNVAALEMEMEDFEDEDVDTNDNDSGEARKWRARGVVRKLHNIVIFIRWSVQRRNKFLDEQLGDLKKVQAVIV